MPGLHFQWHCWAFYYIKFYPGGLSCLITKHCFCFSSACLGFCFVPSFAVKQFWSFPREKSHCASGLNVRKQKVVLHIVVMVGEKRESEYCFLLSLFYRETKPASWKSYSVWLVHLCVASPWWVPLFWASSMPILLCLPGVPNLCDKISFWGSTVGI